MALNKERMKEYMRKRRAGEKELRERLEERLPWPYNASKPPRWGEGVPEYVPLTEDEKEAMEEYSRGSVESGGLREDERPVGATEEEWGYAVERAERARRYAEAMPEHVRPYEVAYQNPVWQWENREMGRERWKKKIERMV